MKIGITGAISSFIGARIIGLAQLAYTRFIGFTRDASPRNPRLRGDTEIFPR